MDTMTVLGKVDTDDLGITLTHEHLLIDVSIAQGRPKEEWKQWLIDAPITLENMGEIRKNLDVPKDNLIIDDLDLVCKEVSHFKREGGQTIVDLTSNVIGRDPRGLKRISQRTGVKVIAGCGYYVGAAHPANLSSKTIDELADEIVTDLTVGMDGTNIRAGIIGEVGISILTKNEEKVLRAAGRAHLRTGAPINVHTSWGRGLKKYTVFKTLDVLEEEGVDLRSVTMSHMGEWAGEDFLGELASRWVFLGIDCFGWDLPFTDFATSMADWYHADFGRVRRVLELAKKGHLGQVLISHDICFKTCLKQYGGYGFDYIPRYVVPMLKSAGLTDHDVRILLVENPKRSLAWGK
jgi:phosphotriesterase-related protein